MRGWEQLPPPRQGSENVRWRKSKREAHQAGNRRRRRARGSPSTSRASIPNLSRHSRDARVEASRNRRANCDGERFHGSGERARMVSCRIAGDHVELTLRARLLARRKINPRTGCWEWQGARQKKGYGNIAIGGRTFLVHRVALHVFRKFDLNSPFCALHKCDNPPCFNPKHLFKGTQRDNIRDLVRKGLHYQTRKTRCLRGHLLGKKNTFGKRKCRECFRMLDRKRWKEYKRREFVKPGSVYRERLWQRKSNQESDSGQKE